MADQKASQNVYNLLAGVNTKASEYLQNQAGFRDLRNFDFFQPNAISKRPGSTQMVVAGTSGPISSLFEFQKLSGASYIVAGSDTAMFYLTTTGYTLLSAGWTNGQPTDMLAYQDKLWMANGQKYQWWNGSSLYAAGMSYVAGITFTSHFADSNTATFMTVAGYTSAGQDVAAGSTFIIVGIWVATSGVRADGYYGPIDLTGARQIVQGNIATSGQEWFSNTVPYGGTGLFLERTGSVTGCTAFAVWAGIDYLNSASLLGGVTAYIGVTNGFAAYTKNGLGVGRYKQSFGGSWDSNFTDQIASTASPAKFYLYTLLPATQVTFSVVITNWDSFASASRGFSGQSFNFFASYAPKYIDQNQNVMFMTGFSTSPSTVQFSEIGQPEITQPDYNFEVRTNDGDVITGQKTYSNTVIVTKDHSFSKIIGSTPDDLALVELSTEYGCLSNKTMVEYDQKLCWLDKRGILEYNGSSWQMISTPVEPVFRRMNLSAAREKACAVNHQYRNQIWFGIPVDGSTQNNITVVYDYLVRAWTFFDGFNPASFALAKGQLNTPTAWRGDYSGLVHSFGESLFGDNGQGITAYGLLNWEIDAGQNSTSIWRRFFLDVASQASGITGAITGRAFADYDASTVRATFSMPQNVFQTRAELGVVGKAVSADFSHYSASLPLVIKGFSWTKRFLRNV